jgi:hypothetical protein
MPIFAKVLESLFTKVLFHAAAANSRKARRVPGKNIHAGTAEYILSRR